jgi:hypothetical protein
MPSLNNNQCNTVRLYPGLIVNVAPGLIYKLLIVVFEFSVIEAPLVITTSVFASGNMPQLQPDASSQFKLLRFCGLHMF